MTNPSPATPPPLPEALTRGSGHPATRPADSARYELDDLLTGKNLFRLGLGLLLLGLAFLFRHAIEEGWIGPAARVAAGSITSLVLLGIGLRIDRRRPSFGQLLQGGGVAGLYLTAFAAHRLYGMVDQTSAFVQLAALAALGVALAVRTRSETLATVSVIGALGAPLLIAGRMTAFGGDAIYLVLVLAATSVLLLRFEWSRMWWIAQGGTTLLVVADLMRYELGLGSAPTALELQMVLGALWLAFYLVPVAARGMDRLSDPYPALIGTGVTTIAAFGASYVVWSPQTSDMVLASAAALLALIHFGARELLARRVADLAEWQLVPATVLAATATVLAFDGPSLVLLLAAEATAIAWLGRKMERTWIENAGHAAFAVVAVSDLVRFVAESRSGTPLLNGPALAQLGIIALASGSAMLLDRDREPSDLLLRSLYAGFALASLMLVLLVELSPVSQAAVTSAWGAIGVAAMVGGHAAGRRKGRLVGSAVVLAAVVKLFLVDLVTAEPIWRIGVFAGFGAVLLVVGYWMSNEE